MKHFLIVYARSKSQVLEFQEFAEQQRAEANAERLKREIQYRLSKDIEVVVIHAESEEQLRETHGRYFRSLQDMLKGLLRPLPS